MNVDYVKRLLDAFESTYYGKMMKYHPHINYHIQRSFDVLTSTYDPDKATRKGHIGYHVDSTCVDKDMPAREQISQYT